ncbi:MAG: cupin-like domain-containing protein [Burkholderiaceae bacterium]|nr:cupin-like domain-containing protein [Burkholderiaceae bacterium]
MASEVAVSEAKDAALPPRALPAAPPEPPPELRVGAEAGADEAPAAGRIALFAAQPGVEAPALRKGKPPDAGWLQWIADNRLRDCTVESMLQTMAAAGLDAAACLQAMRAIEASPAFVAARKLQQLYRKLESVLANQQKLWESAPDYGVVEKRGSVSRAEFIERYVRGCRPVVLTEVARDWPALRRWSPQYLKERFGHLEVEVQAERNRDPNFEINKLALRRRVNLGEFVDRVVGGGSTNDYYLTANNEVLRRPEFAPLLDDIGSLPEFCVRADLPRAANFWFGPAGTNTPLHHDTLMLLHTQVVGRKRWRFISPLETPRLYNYVGVFSPIDLDAPDLVRYPALRAVRVLEVVVEPGETLFLPLGWWHQVTALDVSLSLSYTNLDVPNEFTYADPNVAEWW